MGIQSSLLSRSATTFLLDVQNKTKQNKTKQNKTKQTNKQTKKYRILDVFFLFYLLV